MTVKTLDSKDKDETVLVTFDFTLGLAAGEILQGTPTVSQRTLSGPNPTAALVIVPGSFDATTKKYQCAVSGGDDGAKYLIHVVCATSNANKVLALSASLPIAS